MYRRALDDAWTARLAREDASDASPGISPTSVPEWTLPASDRVDLAQVFARGQDADHDGLTRGFLEGPAHQRLVRGRALAIAACSWAKSPTSRAARRGRGGTSDGAAALKRGDGVVFDRGAPDEPEAGGNVWEVLDARGRSVGKGADDAVRDGEYELTFDGAVARSWGSSDGPAEPRRGDLVWRTGDADLDARLRRVIPDGVGEAPTRRDAVTVRVSSERRRAASRHPRGRARSRGRRRDCRGARPRGETTDVVRVHRQGDWSTRREPRSRLASSTSTAWTSTPASFSPPGDQELSPASGGGVDDGQAKLGRGGGGGNARRSRRRRARRGCVVGRAKRGFERRRVFVGETRGRILRRVRDALRLDESFRRRRVVEVEALALGAVPHAGTGRGGAGGGLAGRDRLGLFGSARASGCGGRGSRERTVRRRRDAAGFETGRGTAVAVLPQARRGRAVGAQRGVDADPDASPRGGRVVGRVRTRARSAASRGFFAQRRQRRRRGGVFSVGARTAHPDARSRRSATGATGRGAGPEGAAAMEVVIHQHLPIFHTEHCVFCRFLSDGNSYKDCGHPCESADVHLRDGGEGSPRAGGHGMQEHGVQRAGAERGGVRPRARGGGVRRFRVELVDEPGSVVAPLMDAYRQVLAGRDTARRWWSGWGRCRTPTEEVTARGGEASRFGKRTRQGNDETDGRGEERGGEDGGEGTVRTRDRAAIRRRSAEKKRKPRKPSYALGAIVHCRRARCAVVRARSSRSFAPSRRPRVRRVESGADPRRASRLRSTLADATACRLFD